MKPRDHSRKGGRSIEQRIWYYLRKAGPSKPCVIAREIDLSLYAARNAVIRLLNKGCVTATGRTNDRRYTAVPSRRPDDLRGTAPGSYAALAQNSNAVRRNRRRDTHPRRLAGIALEQHWKMPQ